MTLAVHGAQRSEEAVGKYRIVSQLGQGGTAEVYLAVADGPSGFQKLVVLKVLKKCLASDDEFRAMFLSEARLAARLHHPHIVQTNEVLEEGGTPVMVMEYLDGQPLSQVIVRGKQGGLTLPMQIRILMDALHGLHAAHQLTDFDGTPLGVVHRDVSPHNIFVTVEGHAKVLDFGIAKLERSLVETEVGTIKGKLRYMAPEQIAGEKLDRRADVYAAGVMLWEALAGERMWKGLSEIEIRARVRAGDLPIAEAARATAPAARRSDLSKSAVPVARGPACHGAGSRRRSGDRPVRAGGSNQSPSDWDLGLPSVRGRTRANQGGDRAEARPNVDGEAIRHRRTRGGTDRVRSSILERAGTPPERARRHCRSDRCGDRVGNLADGRPPGIPWSCDTRGVSCRSKCAGRAHRPGHPDHCRVGDARRSHPPRRGSATVCRADFTRGKPHCRLAIAQALAATGRPTRRAERRAERRPQRHGEQQRARRRT